MLGDGSEPEYEVSSIQSVVCRVTVTSAQSPKNKNIWSLSCVFYDAVHVCLHGLFHLLSHLQSTWTRCLNCSAHRLFSVSEHVSVSQAASSLLIGRGCCQSRRELVFYWMTRGDLGDVWRGDGTYHSWLHLFALIPLEGNFNCLLFQTRNSAFSYTLHTRDGMKLHRFVSQ